MLTLDRRTCLLALKATTDGKEIDGEELKTLTLQLDSVELDAPELCRLLGEQHAWDVLYNAVGPSIEPYLKRLKTLELKEPIEGAFVALNFGLEHERVEFTDVKLSKVTLELQSGGQTAMSCRVTAMPTLDETFARLMEQLGKCIEVELRFEPGGAQQDLPLNNFGEGEVPAQKRKRTRKVAPRADLN